MIPIAAKLRKDIPMGQYTYEHECGYEIDYDCTPGDPGRASGPPERCYPPEPGEIDGPDVCPHCEEEIDVDVVYDKWAAACEADRRMPRNER
jgi:hypothetical protein